jgi:hypothetical protein
MNILCAQISVVLVILNPFEYIYTNFIYMSTFKRLLTDTSPTLKTQIHENTNIYAKLST